MEFVRITVLVAVEGWSDEGGLGVAGAGLVRSWANVQSVERTQAAATNAYKQTLMLTPNLPLLRFLETVCAVNRNAVLIVIAQQQVGIFARSLITRTQRDMGRQLVADSDCATYALEMFRRA